MESRLCSRRFCTFMYVSTHFDVVKGRNGISSTDCAAKFGLSCVKMKIAFFETPCVVVVTHIYIYSTSASLLYPDNYMNTLQVYVILIRRLLLQIIYSCAVTFYVFSAFYFAHCNCISRVEYPCISRDVYPLQKSMACTKLLINIINAWIFVFLDTHMTRKG